MASDLMPVRDTSDAVAAYAGDSCMTGWPESRRYTVLEVIGKGSYGTVCAAIDNYTGERVAIKKITNVFENVADATRILREIKLLRLLKHADIVEIKHIMLPPDPRTYKDLYVVFELLESDLHTVIGANDDLTHDHHKVFLFQLLRGMNFVHASRVLHRDLKPKNILANSNCKLKICDLGLARPILATNASTPVHWTDYVATRWYRAPELCGCFYGRYSQAVDIWSMGCIFGEVLLGKPLFPGRDAVSQLQLITDLLGKPSQATIDRIANQKARAFLNALPNKAPRPFEQKFPNASPAALALLKRLLAFDPAERPTAAQALADPYFANLPNATVQEPAPVHEGHFDFEQCKLEVADVRALIYQEALYYHPMVADAYKAQAYTSSVYLPLTMPGADTDIRMQFKAAEAAGTTHPAKPAPPPPAPAAQTMPQRIPTAVDAQCYPGGVMSDQQAGNQAAAVSALWYQQQQQQQQAAVAAAVQQQVALVMLPAAPAAAMLHPAALAHHPGAYIEAGMLTAEQQAALWQYHHAMGAGGVAHAGDVVNQKAAAAAAYHAAAAQQQQQRSAMLALQQQQQAAAARRW